PRGQRLGHAPAQQRPPRRRPWRKRRERDQVAARAQASPLRRTRRRQPRRHERPAEAALHSPIALGARRLRPIYASTSDRNWRKARLLRSYALSMARQREAPRVSDARAAETGRDLLPQKGTNRPWPTSVPGRQRPAETGSPDSKSVPFGECGFKSHL